MNSTIDNLKIFARDKYAWPGGYPMVLVMYDMGILCHDCTKANYKIILKSTKNKNKDCWQAYDTMVHWEGEPLVCDNCQAEIDSAYGAPE